MCIFYVFWKLFELTWNNYIFGVIVKCSNGELPAQSHHLDTIRVGHFERCNYSHLANVRAGEKFSTLWPETKFFEAVVEVNKYYFYDLIMPKFPWNCLRRIPCPIAWCWMASLHNRCPLSCSGATYLVQTISTSTYASWCVHKNSALSLSRKPVISVASILKPRMHLPTREYIKSLCTKSM